MKKRSKTSLKTMAFIGGLLLLGVSAEAVKQLPFVADDAAQQVYVPPGSYDPYYAFLSGGFNGQLGVYGLPSGRLLKIVPVFSVNPENGYGYTEETREMLRTSHGLIPWDDSHHVELSQTGGETDGRWAFINGNNTPRVARMDLKTFRTEEIIELPNSAGNHPSPFITQDTRYVVAGTRFSVPIPQKDMPIANYKGNFKGTLSFIRVQNDGSMGVAFQILMPGFHYDLSHCGKGPSHGWCFFSSYNTEEAHEILEINASQKDKDFVAAVNWKTAEQCVSQGKAKKMTTSYYHNKLNHKTGYAEARQIKEVPVLSPEACPGLVYLMPTPKSPHGVDVDPTGEYIVAGGKLSSNIAVHSFSKMIKAIADKAYDGDAYKIPILKYEATLSGEVPKACLGPLHNEFDSKGNVYTSCFLSSEIIRWDVKTKQVTDRIPVFYSVGHLMVIGGDSRKPVDKYLIAMNKITKDRYLPTGPELTQSAQLIDISGDKMKMLLDFPTVGEPHYANAITADKVAPNSVRIYKIEENGHPFAAKSEAATKVERKGNEVHVYMTSIRSHFAPYNIEGIQVGDAVYFHVTNLEQDWDVPHGFTITGVDTANMLIMPGETLTIKWTPKKPGVYPFYCTDFCSALHQEMQGYARVSPKGGAPALTWAPKAK